MGGQAPSATRRAMALALLAALLGWMFDGFEMGLFPLVARPALKEMMPDRDLTTQETFTDFTLKADWRLPKKGAGAILLRGTPASAVSLSSDKPGSGELAGYTCDPNLGAEARKLYTPITKADKGIGRWNALAITVRGNRATVFVNGQKVIDGAPLDGCPSQGPLTIQNRGDVVDYRNIEIQTDEKGFRPLLSDKDLEGWKTDAAVLRQWAVRGSVLTCRPAQIGDWFSRIMAVFLVGAACGGLGFGWLGDRIGRVRAMVWSVATYALFSGVCGFATEPWHLAVLRFCSALGMGGEWSLGVALVMEIWPAKSRPMLAGLIGAAANVGFVLIAFMGLGLSQITGDLGRVLLGAGMPKAWVDPLLANSGWRLLLFLGALPALLTFFIRLFVPESARWRHAAASAPRNRITDIFRGGLAWPAALGTILGAIALLGTWGSVQWIPAWADQLSNQLPTAKSLAQISSGFGAILGCILGALFAQWTSRRAGYFALCLLSLGACAYLFRTPMVFGPYFLAWVFVVGGLTAAFYGWLPLYLPELFPTRVRATGQGFAFNFGRVLAAAGTLGAGQLLDYFTEDYARMCSVISLVYIAGIIFIWFCPETKNRPLPE